ncbi:MAG: FecR family protein [Candidatus Andeanibacterium colombiense]|uniref:FecR family protein n=1 Tax=Candidatus Andeanibacterium colombiense TaxID=3121345 RepID=A0AAJ5X3J8_9SPHN|nr:MAG: FecR family protein [Sphingomonadaceae bacterium]
MMEAIVPEFEEPGLDELEAAALWAERLSGPHGLDERAAFEVWLAERPAHEFAWFEMGALREAVQPAARDAAAREHALAPRRRRIGMLAACAAVLVTGFWTVPELALRLQADGIAATGETRDMRLPDGTHVAVNSGSAIDLRFAPGRREVKLLRGEAFFDVARDPAHPFTIAAGDSRVRVLGTHFNVRMDGARTTVTVAQGRVRFGPSENPASNLILTAGQQAFVESGAAQRQPVYDASAAFAWREGQIIFYRAPLRDVVAEIQRYRAAPVFVLGSGIGARTVSGAFSTRTPDVALANTARLLGLRMITLPGGIALIYD